jgi:hypothetical protein
MKLINLYENVQNSVQAMGLYSFVVNLSGNQSISVKNFITGETQTGGTINSKEGDQLEFIYDVEYRGPSKNVVNYKLRHVRNGQERLVEDADFNLNDPEDTEILKTDINLKLRLLDSLLNPPDLEKIKHRYTKLLQS